MFYILLHGCLNNSFISEQSIKVNQLQLQKEQQHPYSAEHVRSRQKNPIREYESYVRCSSCHNIESTVFNSNIESQININGKCLYVYYDSTEKLRFLEEEFLFRSLFYSTLLWSYSGKLGVKVLGPNYKSTPLTTFSFNR